MGKTEDLLEIDERMERKKVKSFSRTCVACPSQWEGELEDGSYFYIRYRNDNFRLDIAPDENEWLENTPKYTVYKINTMMGGYDGYMPDDVMKWFTHFILDFSNAKQPYESKHDGDSFEL
jgi:hypothetical protein